MSEEIVKRLHEQRRIEQAKSILESAGYRVEKKMTESQDVVKLKHIIDTWNMIDKYKISSWEDHDDYITISKEDYDSMLNQTKNQNYIKNLRLGESNINESDDEHIYLVHSSDGNSQGFDTWSEAVSCAKQYPLALIEYCLVEDDGYHTTNSSIFKDGKDIEDSDSDLYPKFSKMLNSIKISESNDINEAEDKSYSNRLADEYMMLKKSYKKMKSFKDTEKESGEIRDFIDELDHKGTKYDIYHNRKDKGCTIFYDK